MEGAVVEPRNEHTLERPEQSESDTQIADQDRVARRAYERFLMRGGEHGYDVDDWYAAERELRETPRE